MSGTKKNDGDNFQNETAESPKKKPTTANKYPFQTTKQTNKSRIINQESSEENLAYKENESKINTDGSKESQNAVLMQVANESNQADQNLPLIVNQALDQRIDNPSLRLDTSESRVLKPQLTTEILMENKIELDLIEVAEKNEEGNTKIRRQDLTEKELDEICGNRNGSGRNYTKLKTPGLDPRFQEQNQTMRCFVMYTDFYRCENILGQGELACQWFKDVFTSICPLDWIRRWDEAREEGRLGWTKGRTQGKFPGNRYGV